MPYARSAVGVSAVVGHITSKSSPGLVAVAAVASLHATMTAAVVDPATCLELTADGAIGELWLCSTSVAAGYYGKPELTAEVMGAQLAAP